MHIREYVNVRLGGIKNINNFCRDVGVSLWTIRSYMYGTRTPSLATALAIERWTGGEVSPADGYRRSLTDDDPVDDDRLKVRLAELDQMCDSIASMVEDLRVLSRRAAGAER